MSKPTAKKTNKRSNQKKPSNKKLNAAQKLSAMESQLAGMYQQINILAEEIDRLGQVVQIIGRRLNASNQAANISSDSVNQIMLNENTKQLEEALKQLVDNKVVARSEDGVVADEKCFVVGREIDKDGNEIAPRIQFAVNTLMPDLKPNFLNEKEGSVIKNNFNENSIEIMEVYNILPQEKKVNFEDSEEKKVQESK